MRYLLTVLTSGRPVCLERTLAAYAQHLSPPPAEVYFYDDGETSPLSSLVSPWPDVPARVESAPRRLGQCAAQAKCWQAAADSDLDWVFHIEDDSVLLRPLDLRDLAAVLDVELRVAQMALVRCPWGAEIEWGGYIPMMPGWYERMESWVYWRGHSRKEWIATARNWANAPALFRAALAREVSFPAEPGCETTLGPVIRAAAHSEVEAEATVFGLWGWGEPWCAHIGVERAPGSYGY